MRILVFLAVFFHFHLKKVLKTMITTQVLVYIINVCLQNVIFKKNITKLSVGMCETELA